MYLTPFLRKLGENDFKLNIPPYLGLHPVFNMDLLRPYFLPLLEYIVLRLTGPEDIHSDVQEPLSSDTIVEQQACHTRTQTIPLF